MTTPPPEQDDMMRVGDSAEEFMLIHALQWGGRGLPALSCRFPSNPLKMLFFARWETTESFCVCFPRASHQVYFLTEAWSAPATHHRL